MTNERDFWQIIQDVLDEGDVESEDGDGDFENGGMVVG